MQLKARVVAAAISVYCGVALSATSDAAQAGQGAEVGVLERSAARTPERVSASPSVRADTEMSAYSDTDHVNVVSPGVSATVSDDVAGWSVGGRYLLDAVTAASVDIVSTASSRWKEQRHVAGGTASYKVGDLGLGASGGVSREPDYLSLGGGATATLDLLNKNLTPFVGLSYGHDDVGRTGLDKNRWETMTKWGLQTGATFVVDRSTIASVQLDVDRERGCLSKPYRYIPLFAPGTGGSNIPAGASVATVNDLRADERALERLPNARDRFALTGRLAHRWTRVTVRVDERLYADNWGLKASTSDARVFVDVGTRWLLWSHTRYHQQTAVSFWKRAYEISVLPDGEVGLPTYRAGDRELSWLYTVTVGAGAKVQLSPLRRTKWALTLQADAARTRYPDTLFIEHRWSIFSALGLGAEW